MNISDMDTKKVKSSYEVEVMKRVKVTRGAFGKIGNALFGEKYKTIVSMEKRTVEFNMGDNSMDIEEQLVNYFENVCNDTLEQMIQDLVAGCVKPFETIYSNFQKLTENTRHELECLKIK